MPTFQDKNQVEFKPLKPGDYQFTVIEFEVGISNASGITKGCESYDMKLEIAGRRVRETLFDVSGLSPVDDKGKRSVEFCQARLDCFLKCCNVVLKPNEAFEFREDVAKEKGVRWINPLGFRGWCRVKNEPDRKDPNKLWDRIDWYYTDKEKLTPVPVADPDADKF